ncbi:gp114 [Synechococcus phage S-CAM8]|uniref:Gp114 n=1 Tax=Synechococcus phage S-CAM8 TaxID=754038 RepID=G8EXN8_9CAUD|nr:gp114 [Synechococcus phage S-CAM8]
MAKGFASDIPPAVNGTAKKYIRGMMKRKDRWSKLYGGRSKEVMHKTANKMAMGEMSKMPPTYKDVFGEANKSGDNSLRDWFGKSKSSDGTPGWVQLGGKFAGKPCAKQPGQTTKPKCGSSKMKRNLNKGEEDAAFRRKNAKDPNPDRKGKAINVKTEDLDLKLMSKELDGASKMHRGQSERIKKHLKKMKKEETINERGDFWHPDPKEDRKLGGPGANQRAREDRAAASKPKTDPKKLRDGESYMDYAKRQKAGKMKKEEFVNEKAGEKDACYKKVKASAKVWPSAYASGRLVQCRKKGAANYGNKSEGITFQQFQSECWKTHKKVGMKMKGGKLVPNCVPKNEEAEKCPEGTKWCPKCQKCQEVTCAEKAKMKSEAAAWTKKSGKNSEGGLNEKGRKSYEAENPGSDLKAPSKKVGNPRRASFCARMKGMRKRQKPSNNTGDDRLSKSLRKWNC